MLDQKTRAFNVEKFKLLLRQHLIDAVDSTRNDKNADILLRAGLTSFRPHIVKALENVSDADAESFYIALCHFMSAVSDGSDDADIASTDRGIASHRDSDISIAGV